MKVTPTEALNAEVFDEALEVSETSAPFFRLHQLLYLLKYNGMMERRGFLQATMQ
jgi:hypothetical protein